MHTYKLKAKCRTGESTGERDRVIGIVKMRAKRKIEAKPLETDSHPRSGVLNLSCLTIAIFPFQIHLPPFLHFHWKLFVTTRYVCVCVCALFHFVLLICRVLVVVIPHILWIYWSEPNQVKMMLRNEMLLATATSEYAAVVLGAMRNEYAMMRFVLFHWKRWLILFDVWAHLSETYNIARVEHERNNNNRFNASTKRFPFHLFFFNCHNFCSEACICLFWCFITICLFPRLCEDAV